MVGLTNFRPDIAVCIVNVMIKTWFFVRSGLYESRGDQKHPISAISDLLNDIPKVILGGSRMYTISCKASAGSSHLSWILAGASHFLQILAPRVTIYQFINFYTPPCLRVFACCVLWELPKVRDQIQKPFFYKLFYNYCSKKNCVERFVPKKGRFKMVFTLYFQKVIWVGGTVFFAKIYFLKKPKTREYALVLVSKT